MFSLSLNNVIIGSITFTLTLPPITDGEYRIFFYNECTVTDGSFECVPVIPQEQVIDASYSNTMMDQFDGTFTYSVTFTRPGIVIMSIFQYIPGGVRLEFYPNQGWTGIPELIQARSRINFNWGTGVVNGTLSDNVGLKIYFRIRAPITGTITFN